MGLPQHWLQPEVVEGMARVAHDRPDARCLDRDPHPRQPRELGHAAGRRRRPGRCSTPASATSATRASPQRRQRRPARAARPVLRAARRRADHAVLLLHVRHDPVLGALAGLGRRRPAAAARASWATCPASRPRGSSATCRSSASAGCTSSRTTTPSAASRYWTKNYRTSIEADGPRGAHPHLRVLRPDPHAARRGPGVVGRARPRSTSPRSGPPRWRRRRVVRRHFRRTDPSSATAGRRRTADCTDAY